MCGRFSLSVQTKEVEKLIPNLRVSSDLPPRYNIAPSQNIAAVLNDGGNILSFPKWGLIPFWAKDPSIGNTLINARAETVHEKPSFKHSLKKRRCLVFADGFYEWKKIKGSSKKSPFFIRMKTGEPFTFAGLWDNWRDPDGNIVQSATLITTSANKLMMDIHHRMPVILDSEYRLQWLDPKEQTSDQLVNFLKPYNSDLMEAYEVSYAVNNPSFDNINCIKPIYFE